MGEIERLAVAPPPGFDRLRAKADAEGVRNMSLIIKNGERFDAPGEALFGAHVNGLLVGVGGVTHQQGEAPAQVVRLRRLYVDPDYRGRGLGRRLAEAMIGHAFATAPALVLNARVPGAAEFWDAIGLVRTDQPGVTHRLERSAWQAPGATTPPA